MSQMAIQTLISLGSFFEAAELAAANLPMGGIADSPRREAVNQAFRSALADGSKEAVAEAVKIHQSPFGRYLSDDNIVDFSERVASDPELKKLVDIHVPTTNEFDDPERTQPGVDPAHTVNPFEDDEPTGVYERPTLATKK